MKKPTYPFQFSLKNVLNIPLSLHFFKKKSAYFFILFSIVYSAQLPAQEKSKITFELQAVINLSGENIESLENPRAISVSITGDVYIADTGHNRIVKLDAKGQYLNHVGGFGWKNNQFDAPVDVFAKDGLNIYVADLNNQRIQRYSKKLEYVTSFGGSKLTELSADASKTFNEPIGSPAGIAVSSQGDLFYSDRERGYIVKINRFGKKETMFGGFAEGRGKLINPGQLLTTSQFVYVVDNKRVVLFDYYGNYIRELGTSVLKKPSDIAIDPKERLYVSDTGARSVVVFDKAGNFLTSVLSFAFEQPVSTDYLNNRLYVLDSKLRSIIVFNILESGE